MSQIQQRVSRVGQRESTPQSGVRRLFSIPLYSSLENTLYTRGYGNLGPALTKTGFYPQKVGGQIYTVYLKS